ncbi:MAG: FkbM family methyltransferase [Magnetococcales bacterium]|nr:FkbM family methyltransferase [Magnetococcales bacterium]
MNNQATIRNEKEIVIYHVGGAGEYGPVMTVIQHMAPHVRLVVFEARNDTDDFEVSRTYTENGIPTTVIFKGVDGGVGNAKFYVTKYPLSSSLLPSSPLAAIENCEYWWCHTWAQNTELDHVIMVDTVTIDDIMDMGAVPPPDIISIDAQGAELRILQGAVKALTKALCVVSEVEFHEIYDGQGLFDDQMKLLTEKGYRLFNIAHQQKWHPGPAVGEGFLTVGEACFMRYAADLPYIPGKRGYVPIETMTDVQLMRLAAIALSFKAYGYAYSLGIALRQRNPELFAEYSSTPKYEFIAQLVNILDGGKEQYLRNPRYWIDEVRVFFS